ncbi:MULTISPECIES: TetR/AcrR family transcriptional regulator [unclassified Sphingobium]|uniref:TetR/AcrR family transcriptional regulator n=1 Tax=unclassified Sphingobium TaxID=2611147 RepID=UPI0016449AED|nr:MULTISPECIES: TetR/AcrR family transcriptional regulator [unclassified Sphingobium]
MPSSAVSAEKLLETPTTRPVKRRSNSKRTGEQLLEAAVSLWSENGLAAVTVTSVAERAKRTRRTVYQHFPTRELLIKAAEEHLDEQLAKLADGHAGMFQDPYGLVAGLAVDSPDLVRTRVLALLGDENGDNPLITEAREWFKILARRGALKDGIDPDHAAVMTLSMWFASILAVSLGKSPAERREQAKRFSQSFVDILSRGAFVEGYRPGSHEPPAPAAPPSGRGRGAKSSA